MSFSSSARTVRDLSRPLGYRVRAFYQCIELFPPFGFNATRQQLRRIHGVTGGEWTDEQLLHGVDLLEHARRSWIADRDGADVRTHRPENRYNRPPAEDGVTFGVWLATYFAETGNAERWGLADLVTCAECRHVLVLHTLRRGCWGCVTGAGVDWEQSCQLPSPLDREGLVDPVELTVLSALWRGWRVPLQRRP